MRRETFRPGELFQNLQFKGRALVDGARGLDFLRTVDVASVGLDPERSHHSSPSGNQYLERVLRDRRITSWDRIIDIGCGKGSAMRKMLEFPFACVDGLEISDRLVAIAEHNFALLKADRCHVYLGDAVDFARYEDYNYLYFANPAPLPVMREVFARLTRSLHALPRETTVIYTIPSCHEALVSDGLFKRIAVYPYERDNQIYVYSNFGKG